ncbi:MAG: DUF928 domain-containing protein [Synechococcales bacterium]|nr:DUF928 domain-containing protein [Synechococcales bacterium]
MLLPSVGTSGAAERKTIPHRRPTKLIRWTPPPPPPPTINDPGGREQGGGSRGPECKPYEKLQVLVPETPNGTRWGLASRDRNTLWLYAPQGIKPNIALELVVNEWPRKRIFKQQIPPFQSAPGVVGIPLPSLPSGKTYQWRLSLFCDRQALDLPISHSGIIQRISLQPKLAKALQTKTQVIEQSRFYAQQGLWYDSTTSLGTAMTTSPSPGVAPQPQPPETLIWAELLQQGGFDTIAPQPLVVPQFSSGKP